MNHFLSSGMDCRLASVGYRFAPPTTVILQCPPLKAGKFQNFLKQVFVTANQLR